MESPSALELARPTRHRITTAIRTGIPTTIRTGLRSTGTGLCDAAPNLRAWNTRLPATDSSPSAVLLYALAVSLDADECANGYAAVASGTAVNSCACGNRTVRSILPLTA